ncbi:Predicted thiol-disulfide oxidoreductase YuxK, DCC family [Catalinimonas alkaloidigena]|uniref:Predicted thiol-disulfide oxidoreductase YuxK, DCC family n=1 Tax=Catalinimonas alkaloidigena TaxID=1075417 RepID=A0A1G9UCX1_9BACT|nr:DCC1-like thiol-disulfide oxidoreductase family protein [Catalinimonas alkaloidigena]SDM57817.1 Predicted thiol-disulfide oxidoreductase YuxK, DCC family [Catalinimonas alkaloidigena]
MNPPQGIVFFDGVCNFCNSAVLFVFDTNTARNLRYASLQSEFAQTFIPPHLYRADDFDTMLYYEGGKFYDRSSAVLKIAEHLKFPYRWAAVFRVIPKAWRDPIYRLIAKNRHALTRKNTCRLMTSEEKQYFLKSRHDALGG